MTRLRTLFGVPIKFRSTALVSGTLATLVTAGAVRNQRWLMAISAGLLWYTADCTHVLGHIASSQMVGAPLDAIDFGLYPKNVYRNNAVSPQQHIGRASGGILASFAAALVLFLFARLMRQGWARKLLTIATIQNTLIFSVSLLPIPMVDGGVILINMRKLYV